MRIVLYLALLGFLCLCLRSQTTEEEFRIYTEHPRLFLRPQRLRLLKRERERDSMRWRRLNALISGGAAPAEPGFALGLYYAVTGDAATGKRAVEWALGPATDLRQLALVYDWCQPILTESQSKELGARIQKMVRTLPASASVSQARDQALAAIATAELNQSGTESALRDLRQKWWAGSLAPKLNAGANLDAGAELQALLELLHAMRDNLTIDLRSDSPGYFKQLATYQVLCNYPAPYPAAENEYRIPIFNGEGEPDLERAALSRAAGLSTVAYDTNALENQYLQGWLIQDRFMLKSTFGAPYEFLWANPYQPGLSYAHLPLTFHDERSGTLFLRSSWEEDAVWFALLDGQAQLFRDGRITVLLQKGRAAAKPEPVEIGDSSVVLMRNRLQCQAPGTRLFIIGAKPRTAYDVEVDDEELTELETDAAGVLELTLPGQDSGVRVQEAKPAKALPGS